MQGLSVSLNGDLYATMRLRRYVYFSTGFFDDNNIVNPVKGNAEPGQNGASRAAKSKPQKGKERATKMKNLTAKIAEANVVELETRNNFCQGLVSLGLQTNKFCRGPNFVCNHPSEDGKTVYFSASDCYFDTNNKILGYFEMVVKWEEPHFHDENCWNCNSETDTFSRPATAAEIEHLVAEWVRHDLANLEERIRLARELPPIPTVDSGRVRRRLEDRIRKDPTLAIAMAQAVGISLE